MSGAIKKATGLTGLPVAKNPHHLLSSLYGKTLRALAKMPESSNYRNSTEKIVSDRAKIVSTNADVTEIEKQIGCGQIEEVIVQAENELTLARKMLGWKAWEPLLREPPKHQWDWPPARLRGD